jgi:hypothetical protein
MLPLMKLKSVSRASAGVFAIPRCLPFPRGLFIVAEILLLIISGDESTAVKSAGLIKIYINH